MLVPVVAVQPLNSTPQLHPQLHRYLKDHKRPPILPVTRLVEGKENSAFKQFVGPAEAAGGGCCVVM